MTLAALWAKVERLASMIRQLQGALGGDRIVRGTISTAGAIVQGHGFSVVRNGAGDYTVTFDTPFSAPPSLSLTLAGTAGTVGIHEKDGTAATATGFSVLTYSTGLLDAGWHFIAAGPP